MDTESKPKVPRYIPPGCIKRKPRTGPPPVPKVAAWGWDDYHISIKILTLAVFFAAVSLTTPFWAYADSATFGLWVYCNDGVCSSIHDNLIPRKEVPAWYHMVQGSFCIGTVASIVGLGILMNNVMDMQLKMTSTVHRTAVCVLGIAALQLSVSICTFITYFDHTNFLYDTSGWDLKVDYHGSFYCGIVSIVMIIFSIFIVLLDDSITRATKSERYFWASRKAPVVIDPRRIANKEFGYKELKYMQ